MSFIDEYLEGGCFLVLDHSDSPVGTGFLIEGNLAVTCEHLLREPYFNQRPERLSVMFADGSTRRFDVDDRVGNDIAILACDPVRGPIGLGHLVSTDRDETNRLQVVGCAPNQRLRTEYAGQATRFDSGDRKRRMIAFNNGQIGPGFSGGPVLDRWTGQVVGMIVGGDEASTGDRFREGVIAVPTQLILDAVRGVSLSAGPVLSRYQGRIRDSFLGEELREFVIPKLSLASSGITLSAEATLNDLIDRKVVIGITGPSGLGKSTLLAHLACRYSSDDSLGTVPILFSLHRALESQETGNRARILDAARRDETFRAAGLWEDKDMFDPLLWCDSLDRSAVFLIDGVDEALRSGTSVRLLEDLIRTIREREMSAIIAARDPRLLGLKNVAMPWYELLGFDGDAQQKFISRYSKLGSGTRARARLSRLPKGILERPLLLKLAAEVLGDDDDVGSVKSLYVKYIENEIKRAIDKDREQRIVVLRLLQELALLTWNSRSSDELRLDAIGEIAIETVSDVLGIARVKCEAALQDGLENLGKARALCWVHKGEIRWAHSSFQEFLAAQALVSKTKVQTDEIVLQLVRKEQEQIDVAAFAMALLSKPAQESLLDAAVKEGSRVLRGVAARAISFGIVTPKYQLAVAEGLLNDLRLRCKDGEQACAVLWTAYSGETCSELERLLDVGGDAAECVLVNAINRPEESLILLSMYVAVLGKMGAWNALRKMVCNWADDTGVRIACLATLLDNSELSVLEEYVQCGCDDELTPFVWDALRRNIGLEEARSLALRKSLEPIELEDAEVIHSRLSGVGGKTLLKISRFSVNRSLVRIAVDRPDLLSNLDTRLISLFDLDRVRRAFETSSYEKIPQYHFDTRRDLVDLRVNDVIHVDDTDEARRMLIGLASCPEADEVTKVLAVSALFNYGAVQALDLITKSSIVTQLVRAAAHERLTRSWTLWANRLRVGVLGA